MKITLRDYASGDIAVFLGAVALLFFWGISRGKNRIKYVILASYIATVLFGVLPITQLEANFSLRSSAILHVGVMAALIVILVYFLQQIFRTSDTRGSAIQTLLLSVIAVGFLMNILLTHVSPVAVPFSAIVLELFSPNTTSWWWHIVPILGIIFL